MSQRRDNRVAAIQFLYEWDARAPDHLGEALRVFFEETYPRVQTTEWEEARQAARQAAENPASAEPKEITVLPPEAIPVSQESPASAARGAREGPPGRHRAGPLPATAPVRPREYYGFAEELARGVIEHMAEVDETIREHARNWDFKRISRIDLAILRLAIYEMLHRKDIPPIVSINEAIDLSKNFSIPDAKRFINGILDQVKLKLNRPLREPAL